MSSFQTSPEILVNGEQQLSSAEEEGCTAPVSTHDEALEGSSATEKETQVKMQSVFQQVRNQIRLQSGIRELVQKVKDREIDILLENKEAQGKDVTAEEEEATGAMTDKFKGEMDLTLEALCAIFEIKLEASKKTSKDELQVQISLLRKEMEAYIKQALTDLECKIKSSSFQQTRLDKQQQTTTPGEKRKPSTASSLTSHRRKVLTRTMTTIVPKTSVPSISGQRTKSETGSWKGQSSRFLPRNRALSLPEKMPLPPARPPLLQCKKQTAPLAKTAK